MIKNKYYEHSKYLLKSIALEKNVRTTKLLKNSTWINNFSEVNMNCLSYKFDAVLMILLKELLYTNFK